MFDIEVCTSTNTSRYSADSGVGRNVWRSPQIIDGRRRKKRRKLGNGRHLNICSLEEGVLIVDVCCEKSEGRCRDCSELKCATGTDMVATEAFSCVGLPRFGSVRFGKISEPEPEPKRTVRAVRFWFSPSPNLNRTERAIRFRFRDVREPEPEPKSKLRECKREESKEIQTREERCSRTGPMDRAQVQGIIRDMIGMPSFTIEALACTCGYIEYLGLHSIYKTESIY